jgi:hypothetical protein
MTYLFAGPIEYSRPGQAEIFSILKGPGVYAVLCLGRPVLLPRFPVSVPRKGD